MKLSYPVTSELLTLNFSTYRTIEKELRRQHDLSALQYRSMSVMEQGGDIAESRMIDKLGANVSQLSQNLSKLAERGLVSWAPTARSARTWQLTKLGRALLVDADLTIIQVYDRYFAGLSAHIEQSVRPGLRMTSLAQGTIRVKDGGYFDEQAFFETILAIVQTVIVSTKQFDLSAAQFRILFRLLSEGPAIKAHLAKELMLTRSTVNWACEALFKRNFLCVVAGMPGKAIPVALTGRGRMATEQVAELVDQAWCGIRVWSPEEKLYNQQVGEYFVRSFAR